MIRLKLTPTQKILGSVLAGAVLILAVLHIIGVLTIDHIWYINRWFSLDGEWNVASVFSGMLLAFCSFTALLLSAQTTNRPERWRWWGVAALFLYLAFDEILIIHEQYAEPLRGIFAVPNHSLFYHAWVLLAMFVIVVLVAAVSLLRSRTPVSRFQRRVLLYIIFLAVGAVVIEMLGTQLYFSSTVYQLGPVLVEELFELGMVSFILVALVGFLLPANKRAVR